MLNRVVSGLVIALLFIPIASLNIQLVQSKETAFMNDFCDILFPNGGEILDETVYIQWDYYIEYPPFCETEWDVWLKSSGNTWRLLGETTHTIFKWNTTRVSNGDYKVSVGYRCTGSIPGEGYLLYDESDDWFTITNNHCPYTPETPDGPSIGITQEQHEFTTITEDPEDDTISYGWDWNGDDIVDEWSKYQECGITHTHSNKWDEPGIYEVQVKAKDNHGAISDFSGITTIELYENHPPNQPITPVGQTNGRSGNEYIYETRSFDKDDTYGDVLYYKWDFGDGTTSEWLGPFESNQTCVTLHTWHEIGTYDIRVKAKDNHEFESSWATLEVQMPKQSKISSYLLHLLTNYNQQFRMLFSKFF